MKVKWLTMDPVRTLDEDGEGSVQVVHVRGGSAERGGGGLLRSRCSNTIQLKQAEAGDR